MKGPFEIGNAQVRLAASFERIVSHHSSDMPRQPDGVRYW